MDIVFIEGLTVETIIGVYEWERNVRQTLNFDIDMGFDIAQAMISDHLKDTLNYATVAEDIRVITDNHNYELLEALTGQIVRTLMEKYSLSWIKLKVRKIGAVANAASVGLVVERGSR